MVLSAGDRVRVWNGDRHFGDGEVVAFDPEDYSMKIHFASGLKMHLNTMDWGWAVEKLDAEGNVVPRNYVQKPTLQEDLERASEQIALAMHKMAQEIGKFLQAAGQILEDEGRRRAEKKQKEGN